MRAANRELCAGCDNDDRDGAFLHTETGDVLCVGCQESRATKRAAVFQFTAHEWFRTSYLERKPFMLSVQLSKTKGAVVFGTDGGQ